MGYYVNPTDGRSKETWLEQEGHRISEGEVMFVARSGEELPVCLVDNGWMTAAGIGYCAEEAEQFLRPDGRPKRWYAVRREKLVPFAAEVLA